MVLQSRRQEMRRKSKRERKYGCKLKDVKLVPLSKEPNRSKRCNKNIYLTEGEASSACIRTLRRGGAKGMRYYWCNICHGYHLTSQNKKKFYKNEKNSMLKL
jgi:hypothetical protein